MAVNKNFVVKHGLEVNENLVFADPDLSRVGISTNAPQHTLDVIGGIGASTLSVNNQLNVQGLLSAGSTVGKSGQYLISTGTGVTWASLPNTRKVYTSTAGVGQTSFSVSYLVGLVDVFINGVKLSESEFTANDGIAVYLDDSCFGGETVEFVVYSAYSVGGSESGTISILDENNIVSTTVNSINFVGAGITANVSGFGVTVTLLGGSWDVNENNDFYTLENLGIGTDDPQYGLDVNGDINFTGTFYQNGSEYVASRWTAGAGSTIYRDSFVGIGSTLPQKTLDVGGDINFSGGLYQGGSPFVASRWTAGAGSTIYRLDGNIGIGTTDPTRILDVNGDVRIRNDLHLGEDGNVGTAGSILYTAGSGSGLYWGPPVGSQGVQGLQGVQGESIQGAQGVQGESIQGAQGVQGESIQGTQGLQGLQGVQGVQGLDGLYAGQGTQGLQGLQGVQGESIQGTQGVQGESIQGTQGVQGESVQGTQGLQGLQGVQGTQGLQGLQGLQGVQGLQGLQGLQGVQGLQGLQGLQGVQGLSNQGVQGLQGLQGVQGLQGLQGPQGVQGLSNQGVQGLQGLQGLQGTYGPATIPQNSQTSAYIIGNTDSGKHISITTGGITVPANLTFGAGDNVVVFNDSGSNQTITSGIGITMYLAGTASTGNRTLLQRGIATILCISSNRYVISGAGLT